MTAAPSRTFWSIGELMNAARCSEADIEAAARALHIAEADLMLHGVPYFNGTNAEAMIVLVNKARETLAIATTADQQAKQTPTNLN